MCILFNFNALCFHLQEFSFLLTVIIVFFHYSVYARPKSREDWMGQDNDDQATSQTLGKDIKLFSRQKFLNANQITEERSLRFRRNHNSTSNPCFKAEKVEMFAAGLAVKVHECFTTTNLGCRPVNGKFLCEKIKSVVNDSAGNLYAYNSGCRCAKAWLKITLFNKRVLIILYWFGFVTLNKVIAANYLMSLLNLNSSDYLYPKSVWYTLIMLTNLWQ